jgi:hypothetical protein
MALPISQRFCLLVLALGRMLAALIITVIVVAAIVVLVPPPTFTAAALTIAITCRIFLQAATNARPFPPLPLCLCTPLRFHVKTSVAIILLSFGEHLKSVCVSLLRLLQAVAGRNQVTSDHGSTN